MNELDRLRDEFASLDGGLRQGARHVDETVAHGLILEERTLLAGEMLAATGFEDLAGRFVLDVGSGSGDSLELLQGREAAACVIGVDTVQRKLERVRETLPGVRCLLADAGALPLADESVDLVLAFTLFSSLVRSSDIPRVACEILRVLRPGGVALVYDYRRFPGFGADGGLAPGEVEALFEGCEITARRVTLAPPIARRVASVTSTLFALKRSVPGLRTYDLHCVRKHMPGAEGEDEA